MAAYVPAALKRTALEADGWLPVGIPLGRIGSMFDEIKGMAKNAGRDPSTLALIVRANVEFDDAPIDKERLDFTGTLEQIAQDIKAVEELGAAEIVLDAQFSPGVIAKSQGQRPLSIDSQDDTHLTASSLTRRTRWHAEHAFDQGRGRFLGGHPDEIVPYKILPVAGESVQQVVRSRLRLFSGVDPVG